MASRFGSGGGFGGGGGGGGGGRGGATARPCAYFQVRKYVLCVFSIVFAVCLGLFSLVRVDSVLARFFFTVYTCAKQV